MTNASRAYIYNDWFYICKDLMEGKINYNYNYKTPRTNYPVTQGHIPHDIIVQQNCLFAQDTFAHCSVISAHTHVWQTSPYTRMTNFTIHTYDKLHHTQVWQTSPYTGMTNFTKLQSVLDASSTCTSITTISTSWFYLYMDIWKIKKWMNENFVTCNRQPCPTGWLAGNITCIAAVVAFIC